MGINILPATHIPSGISDEAGSIGAVESNDGLLDVIDLLKGERITLSEIPMVPLFLRGQEILVHKRDPASYTVLLELLRIDGSGLASLWSEELPLPDWALEDAATLSFDVELRDNTFHISWTAQRVPLGGIVRSDDYKRAQAGLIQIDEKSGAIGRIEEIEPTVVDPYEAYELALSLELIPFRRGPDRIEVPWLVDGRQTFLTRQGLGGTSGVFLRFRENGEHPQEREVALSEDTIQDPIVTTDGRMLLLFNGAGWDLFSTLDGTPQGSLPMEKEAAEVSMIGSRVIYAVDEMKIGPYQIATRVRRSLRARNLQGGALLWAYFLHDKELLPDPRTIPGKDPPSMPGA